MGKCPLCQKGSILENTKAYYCTAWKEGCQFTIWKNTLEPYGVSLDSKIVKKLLKEKKIKDISIVLPQTGERGKATLLLSNENTGKLEWMDFIRNS